MASTSVMENHLSYDVFLSFRGEDTRLSFTAHLYDALIRAGIRTFRDNDEIPRGEDLKPEIEKAIQKCKASIVVVSENYANSRWCLDELLLILEQRQDFNHFVLPVFIHVDPSHVRNHEKTFAIKVDEGSKWTEYNVNRWKAALTQVSNLTGEVLSGSETDFITKIVDIVYCKLDLKLVIIPSHLTGMDTRSSHINSWLKTKQSGAEFLAICGMGGIGKTTLAQYIYNSNKQSFESCSFLQEIGKHCKQPSGLLDLQKQLLKDILGVKNEWISNVSEGTCKIEKALQMKAVLIVLDDIDEHDQLASLLGTKTFHSQSKIILTTRLLDINSWFGSISQSCEIYDLRDMADHESLQLLSYHAFGSKIPMEGFKDLTLELVKYCGGNPLALKVLGSSLFVSTEDPKKINSMIEVWTTTLNSLKSQNGDLHNKIQDILRKSFDSLPFDSHKELFLHIACFFVGKNKDYVVNILEHDWYAKAGILTLVNRCLLTISPNKKLMMHQLLQDMGRNIVREKSKDPAEHSRVWRSDEAYDVLRKGDGSKSIEGLAFDASKHTKERKPLVLETGSFAKIDKLKLLQLNDVKLIGSYKNFPELRWLCWHECHLKTIPSGFLMGSLVAVDMSYGHLEKFEIPVGLDSLKILNLTSSQKLVSVYNICRVPNLEKLDISYCISLTHVCKTIGGLKKLAQLNLQGATKLWKASSNKTYVNQLERLKASLRICGGIPEQPLFSLPDSLKYLVLNYNHFGYKNDFPVVFNCQSLLCMSLQGNQFEYLPNNIDFKMLRILDLCYCENLKSILCLPSTLKVLYTNWCTSLEKITFESSRFGLEKFGYGGCIKLSEVQGLFKLVPIAKLNEADLGHMKWIKAYEDLKVDLVGDEITKGRIWHIQMLYEYGIRSTYLQGIKDQRMTASEYITSSSLLSFRVPLCPTKCRIEGLNITSSYRSSGSENEHINMRVLFAKISNKTKGLTWIYNPVVYCKPIVDEDVVWLSYWPIGNVLDAGDEVNVSIIVGDGLIVSGCGASLVYTDCELKQDKNLENTNTKGEEVIDGDLSEFELTTGVYYLCRRDFLKSTIPDWFKMLLDDTIHSTELQEWRKSYQPHHMDTSFSDTEISRDTLNKKIVLLANFNSKTTIRKMMKVLCSLEGVESISFDITKERLIVTGYVDPVTVVTCVRKYVVAEIISADYVTFK